MTNVLFYSDVVLDVYLNREPHAFDSLKALKHCG